MLDGGEPDPGSSSPRPQLTAPPRGASPSTAPIGRGLVFAGRLAKNGSRAHVFPRIKCPEKIVDSCARVGVLAAPEDPLTSPNLDVTKKSRRQEAVEALEALGDGD